MQLHLHQIAMVKRQIALVMVLLFLCSILIIACTAKLSQQQAQDIAKQFMDERVKFYVKDNATGKQLVENYTIESLDSIPDGNDWYVYFHITKDSKKNDIAMKVSSSSKKVVELNGKGV